jgi:hypothetical protein
MRACARWWHALSRAQYTAAVSFRQDIAFFECRAWSLELLDAFFSSAFEPQRCVSVIEGLVHEGLLSRAEGSVLQDACLRQTDAQGRWSEVAPEATPRSDPVSSTGQAVRQA